MRARISGTLLCVGMSRLYLFSIESAFGSIIEKFSFHGSRLALAWWLATFSFLPIPISEWIMILFLWRERWSEQREGQKKTPLSADDDDAEVDVLIPTAPAPSVRGDPVYFESDLEVYFWNCSNPLLISFASCYVILLTFCSFAKKRKNDSNVSKFVAEVQTASYVTFGRLVIIKKVQNCKIISDFTWVMDNI